MFNQNYFCYRLNGYFLENRNLFRINDTIRRQKFLKQGRLPVVSFVSEMPRTRHLLNTFTMDLSLVTVSSHYMVIYCNVSYITINRLSYYIRNKKTYKRQR